MIEYPKDFQTIYIKYGTFLQKVSNTTIFLKRILIQYKRYKNI